MRTQSSTVMAVIALVAVAAGSSLAEEREFQYCWGEQVVDLDYYRAHPKQHGLQSVAANNRAVLSNHEGRIRALEHEAVTAPNGEVTGTNVPGRRGEMNLWGIVSAILGGAAGLGLIVAGVALTTGVVAGVIVIIGVVRQGGLNASLARHRETRMAQALQPVPPAVGYSRGREVYFHQTPEGWSWGEQVWPAAGLPAAQMAAAPPAPANP